MAQRGGGWAIKIGLATDPDRRLRQVQIGSQLPLYLAHTVGPMLPRHARQAEQMMHEVFDEFRMVGEWFRMPPEHGARLLDMMWEAIPRG
jgi:hypothetical protein